MRKIFINADVVTMEETNNVTAILCENGRIKNIGRDLDILNLKKDGDIVIDLKGRTLMPSFIDPHSHITSFASTLSLADVSKAKNFNEIIDILNKYKLENDIKKDGLILGFGYDNNFLEEKSHLDKFILDKVSKEVPVLLAHKSGHMGVVNSKGLEYLNITKDTKDIQGGKIGRVENTNEPNGYLEELFFINSASKFPKPSVESLMKNIEKAQDIYASYGITTCQDGKTTKEEYYLLKEAAKNNKLKLDTVMYIDMKKSDDIILNADEYLKKYNNRLKIGGYKIFLDGSPQGKTAWMKKPYENEEEYKGYPIYKDSEVEDFIKQASLENMQLLAHCNGDAASEQYISAFEKLNIPNNIRPVMIHAQLTEKNQIERMKKINMIPSFFNLHVYYFGDVHVKNFGIERAKNISNAKEAIKCKIPFTFHQDTPVLMPNMLESIWCSVNRKTLSGYTLGEENIISTYDALKAVTINAAYQYFEEENKGSIKEGKLADLVVLSDNPLKVDKDEIKNIKVLETYKEGNLIYKNKFSI